MISQSLLRNSYLLQIYCKLKILNKSLSIAQCSWGCRMDLNFYKILHYFVVAIVAILPFRLFFLVEPTIRFDLITSSIKKNHQSSWWFANYNNRRLCLRIAFFGLVLKSQTNRVFCNHQFFVCGNNINVDA